MEEPSSFVKGIFVNIRCSLNMLHKILQVYCILAHVQGMSQELQLGAKEIRHWEGRGGGCSNPQKSLHFVLLERALLRHKRTDFHSIISYSKPWVYF